MTCNHVILAQPQANGTVSYTIPEGESARLNFDPGEIAGLHLGDSGELIISFADGGQLTITNFQDLVDSNNLIYLADGTLIDPNVLTNTLQTVSAFTANDDVVSQNVETISKPSENISQTLELAQGQKYLCDFNLDHTAMVEVKDGQLVLTFADGSQVVISNYTDVIAGELPPELTLADGTVINGDELLTNVTDVEDLSEVANIEPAAGDEDIMGEEDLAALAEQLAEVQPAAGEASGGVSNSGYGFNSMPSSDPLDSPDAIGPLDPTRLQYNAPEVTTDTYMAEVDDRPIISPAVESLDETSLSNGAIVLTGNLNVNYGNDTPGVIVANGNVSVSGSTTPTGELFSGGVPVVITHTSSGYVGTAGATTVFTLEVTPSGGYTFTQLAPLDHADGTDDNDVININFGVTATDFDGDRTPTVIRVQIADDAPVVLSQVEQTTDESFSEIQYGGHDVVNGQFYADVGQDAADNPYSANDTFEFSGSVANGELTSNGVAVTVSSGGDNVYTGTANGVVVFTLTLDTATGEYTYRQYQPLDHADGSDANDVIQLQFGIDVTDYDGDVADGFVTINVIDDAPELNDFSGSLAEQDLSSGPIVIKDSLGADFNADGSGEVSTTGDFQVSGVGSLTHNGVVVTVTSTPTGYIGTAGSVTVFTLELDSQTGEFTYTQLANLDHGTDDVIKLTFGTQITDFDGDTDTANIVIDIIDSVPEFQPNNPQPDNGLETVDETDFANGPLVETGKLEADFGADSKGTYVGNDTGLPTGLTHCGQSVTVSFDADSNTYTGTVAGSSSVIFTLVIDPETGDYTYTQHLPLDHPSSKDSNDAITLEFSVDAIDGDGDVAQGSIIINVLDDGPVAEDDFGSVREGVTLEGNVLDNDDVGADGLDTIVDVRLQQDGNHTTGPGSFPIHNPDGSMTVIGEFGILNLAQDGSYTYTPKDNDPEGIDVFTYTIRDCDGDTATATLTIDVSPDYDPIVVNEVNQVDETNFVANGTSVTGTVNIDYQGEGPGVMTSNGNFAYSGVTNLTSNGFSVAVTLNNLGYYVGTANGQTVFELKIGSNGDYTFNQFEPLDHADPNNPNDSLELEFGVTATDVDGDTTDGTITITVYDDGPVAQDDAGSVREDSVLTGNVLDNDDAGADGQGAVHQPGTYAGSFGTLVIDADGSYTYTANGTGAGVDTFAYSIVDADGDTADATLTIDVTPDEAPIEISGSGETDDSALVSGPDVETGTINVNYQGDGPGVTTGNGNFMAVNNTNLANGVLSHNGVAINVTFDAATNTYTGMAGTVTVFDMIINSNGTYTFTQHETLDHGDANNNNEAITLRFGVTATDSDGDSGNGTVSVQVLDDGPVANNDSFRLYELDAKRWDASPGDTVITQSVSRLELSDGAEVWRDTGSDGKGFWYRLDVLANDDAGRDNGTVSITNVGFKSGFYAKNTDLAISPDGQYILIRIGQDGNKKDNVIQLQYELTSADGDTDTATVNINISDRNSPLVLDLDGDGVELLNIDHGVAFDMDNDGDVEQTGWVASDDAFLVLDKNQDGIVNNKSEMFGDSDGSADGFANLASHDSNDDGVIDANDDIYEDLQVWQDIDSDGITDAGELLTLAQIGIASISLNANMPEDTYIEGSWISHVSAYTTVDGQTHDIVDAWFDVSEIETTSGLITDAINESVDTLAALNSGDGSGADLSLLLDQEDDVTGAIEEFVYSNSGDGADNLELVNACKDYPQPRSNDGFSYSDGDGGADNLELINACKDYPQPRSADIHVNELPDSTPIDII